MPNIKRSDDRLLHCHKLHLGLYARVAKNVDASATYISLVAAGKRRSERIKKAIMAELKRIEGIRTV
jgi:hypothetical protein